MFTPQRNDYICLPPKTKITCHSKFEDLIDSTAVHEESVEGRSNACYATLGGLGRRGGLGGWRACGAEGIKLWARGFVGSGAGALGLLGLGARCLALAFALR